MDSLCQDPRLQTQPQSEVQEVRTSTWEFGGGHRSALDSPHHKACHQRRWRGHCWGLGRGEGVVSAQLGEEGGLEAGRRGGLEVWEPGLGRGLQALGIKPGPGAWLWGGERSLLSLKAQGQEKPGVWGRHSGRRVGLAGGWRCCGSPLSARGPGRRWRDCPGTQTPLPAWGRGRTQCAPSPPLPSAAPRHP